MIEKNNFNEIGDNSRVESKQGSKNRRLAWWNQRSFSDSVWKGEISTPIFLQSK